MALVMLRHFYMIYYTQNVTNSQALDLNWYTLIDTNYKIVLQIC